MIGERERLRGKEEMLLQKKERSLSLSSFV